MRQKLTIIAALILLTKFSYSQTVLIDKSGDTTICITLPQMDKVYIELLQKDSLLEQAILSHSKELLLYEVIDSAKKDIEFLETLVYAIDSENLGLHLENENQKTQIRTNRTISFISLVTLFLFIAL
tara:strand:+ start:322 stop:702 length:381 start_codon:yes stop_codon:yes gene_type:complete